MLTSSPSSRRAVGELYVQHHGWVVQLLRRKLGNQEQALDLAQDTFVRMLRTDTPAPLREPRAYLTTIASRLCGQYFRRQALERAYMESLALLEPQLVPSRNLACWCWRHWTPSARCSMAWAQKCGRFFYCRNWTA